MAIVLVIIGLVVGGILVGTDLLNAAAIRQQISQIEQFNTAANTFRGKYGYLPGDIKDPDASRFGLAARGTNPGQGDGNGLIEGWNESTNSGVAEGMGETVMFWEDLSTAKLVSGGFSSSSSTYFPIGLTYVTPTSTPSLSALFPESKMVKGNYIYVYSNNSQNYFGLSSISQLQSGITLVSGPGLTVRQAYAIDSKVHDGVPNRGRITTNYIEYGIYSDSPYGTYGNTGASCYNLGISNTSATYNVMYNNGNGVYCALSFRMGAGD